jgi:hypothetical protein
MSIAAQLHGSAAGWRDFVEEDGWFVAKPVVLPPVHRIKVKEAPFSQADRHHVSRQDDFHIGTRQTPRHRATDRMTGNSCSNSRRIAQGYPLPQFPDKNRDPTIRRDR